MGKLIFFMVFCAFPTSFCAGKVSIPDKIWLKGVKYGDTYPRLLNSWVNNLPDSDWKFFQRDLRVGGIKQCYSRDRYYIRGGSHWWLFVHDSLLGYTDVYHFNGACADNEFDTI